MIQIGRTLVSNELLEEAFHCDLSRCHGACCVAGDSGAPLDPEEVQILGKIRETLRPHLRPEGNAAIDAQAPAVKDADGDWTTPLVEGKECAYVLFDGPTALCGIERAWKQGVVNWRKPISCHLYPVRIKRYPSFEAVNYDRWEVCSPACELGKAKKVKVYEFLQEALVRKYGSEWYAALRAADHQLGPK